MRLLLISLQFFSVRLLKKKVNGFINFYFRQGSEPRSGWFDFGGCPRVFDSIGLSLHFIANRKNNKIAMASYFCYDE
jgi:hypothetical protein